MKKKIISLALTLVMVLALTPLVASGDNTDPETPLRVQPRESVSFAWDWGSRGAVFYFSFTMPYDGEFSVTLSRPESGTGNIALRWNSRLGERIVDAGKGETTTAQAPLRAGEHTIVAVADSWVEATATFIFTITPSAIASPTPTPTPTPAPTPTPPASSPQIVDGVHMGTYRCPGYSEWFTVRADGTATIYGNFGNGFETIQGRWERTYHDGDYWINFYRGGNDFIGWLGIAGDRLWVEKGEFGSVPPGHAFALDGTPATPQTPAPPLNNNMSAWAIPEITKAYEMGLIPDSLLNPGIDYTRPITRAEFAGVAVKTYENMTGTQVAPTIVNPFVDTSDMDALKAYNAGIMVGVSSNAFEPNTPLNREQCATALTRVFKRFTIPGWSFTTDASHTLQFTRPPLFADDHEISGWARESVYFMAANGIILGVGNNRFAPRNITGDQEARGYATATREQAIAIAVRMVENLR